jgi:hypothetical protein
MTPEYTQALRDLDAARAERDEARAALERLVGELQDLLRKWSETTARGRN